MKRLLFCIALVAGLMGVIIYADRHMERYEQSVTRLIADTRKQIEHGMLDLADESLEGGIERLREKEHIMAIFVRREQLARLEEFLCAARSYALAGNEEETCAELARAESHMYNMKHQFSKLI